MGGNGQVNDYYNCLMLIVFCNSTHHHVMIALETWNHTGFSTFWYLLSYSMIFVTAYFNNDLVPTSDYYQTQFTIVMASPLFWLTSIPIVWVTVLPRYLDTLHEALVRHPEFTKIKE